MEIASFEPVVGRTYEFGDMSIVLKGVFKGFIRHVRSTEFNGKKITMSRHDVEPLMLFEIARPPGSTGYRYAGVHVSTYYDTHKKRIRFSLSANHFGNTVGEIGRHGPQPRYYWKKV